MATPSGTNSIVEDPMHIMREIGSLTELRASAGEMPSVAPDHNAHLHLPPNFSAFSTVAQAMELAAREGCRMVGASNYYNYETYRTFASEARQWNIFPLFGMEIICMIDDLRSRGIKINDPANPGKMYICGKGITRWAKMPAEAREILDVICRTDAERTRKLVECLSQVLLERGLASNIRANDVIDLVVRRHGVPRETVFLQERHVALAFQEHLFAIAPAAERVAILTRLFGAAPRLKSPEDPVGVQNELRSHLMKAGKPGYVEETFIDFVPAMRLIHALGGFASYPLLADAAPAICPFEETPEKLAAHLLERRIYAAEFITPRNDAGLIARYTRVLRAAGIIVTAGTEHNLLEMIPLAPDCLGGVPIPADIKAVFYEGACVIAAHQFLGAHGEAGYRGDAGQVGELARLGHAVVGRYLGGTR